MITAKITLGSTDQDFCYGDHVRVVAAPTDPARRDFPPDLDAAEILTVWEVVRSVTPEACICLRADEMKLFIPMRLLVLI